MKMNERSRSEESDNFIPPRKKLELARETNPKPEMPEPAPEPPAEEKKEDKKSEDISRFREEMKKNKGYVTLFTAFKAILENGKLLLASMGIVLLMLVISLLIYHWIDSFVDVHTREFFSDVPADEGLLDQLWFWLKWCGKALLKMTIFILSFYTSFMISYLLVSPLYSFVSNIAENVYYGRPDDEADFSLRGVLEDMLQAVKISVAVFFLGVLVFLLGFIPILGQLLAILLCVFINSLLLLDFPASRRRWPLLKKMKWIFSHPGTAFGTGVFPTAISLIPILNNIIMAFMFPVFIVHAAMNFAAAERDLKE